MVSLALNYDTLTMGAGATFDIKIIKLNQGGDNVLLIFISTLNIEHNINQT